MATPRRKACFFFYIYGTLKECEQKARRGIRVACDLVWLNNVGNDYKDIEQMNILLMMC